MTTMVAYFKKSLNSKMYQGLNYKDAEFNQIVSLLSKPFDKSKNKNR